MTSSTIIRGAIALCSLIFLAITGIAAVAPGGQHFGVAVVYGMLAMGLAVIAARGVE
jgi:hypothetical protein